MTDGAQLQLELPPPDWGARWDEDRQLLRRCVDDLTVKEAAFRLDVQPSLLLHSLEGREYHYFRASWVPVLVAGAACEAADHYVARLAALRGLEVAPARPVTPEQELAALKDVLSEQLGNELRTAILARAKARAKR